MHESESESFPTTTTTTTLHSWRHGVGLAPHAPLQPLPSLPFPLPTPLPRASTTTHTASLSLLLLLLSSSSLVTHSNDETMKRSNDPTMLASRFVAFRCCAFLWVVVVANRILPCGVGRSVGHGARMIGSLCRRFSPGNTGMNR